MIDIYTERFSTATIYILFTTVSLIVAIILFGFLHSTGAMKLAFAGSVETAEFGGAFSGFLITLIILLRYYNAPSKTLSISGNVLFNNGQPVEHALVFVDGVE